MKDLIIQALSDAFEKLQKQLPETKRETKTISILDVKPSELMSFMESNNIPKDAYFNGADNGYDAWDDIVLAWEVEVPTSEKEKLDWLKHKFNSFSSWHYVHKLLTQNGYKRIPYDSRNFKQFNDTTVYNMFREKNFDRLVEYYSGHFKKI